MRAIAFHGRELEFRHDVACPERKVGEALVRVRLAGICSTDLEIIRGYFGFCGVLGHEFVGVVDASSDPKWIGKRVVSSINFVPLDSLDLASTGAEHHPGRQVLGIFNRDGAMADWVAIPERYLLEVPDSVTDSQAVFAEPLAAALRIAQQLPIRPDSQIAVIGAGRLGMLVAGVLSLGGAHVTVIARNSHSLELAKQWGMRTGMTEQVNSHCFDMVVEATGNSDGLRHAMRITKPCGTIVMKSTYADPTKIDLTPIVVNELRVVGSRCGPMAPALRLMERKSIDVLALMECEYAAEDALKAFQHAHRPGVRKVLLRFSS
jgi:threonine dehydrogenase-like Zn-dependent dehydrogenase